MSTKVLAGKGYGSIGHLPGSRVGPGDHYVNEGQARICTVKARDKHDEIIVQEKVDGSNVGVACINGQSVAINRAGYAAASSPWEQHRLFDRWVWSEGNWLRFAMVLREGERLMGEWLAQAHGTRYNLVQGPFVALDLFSSEKRLPYDEFLARLNGLFVVPRLIHRGGPVGIDWVRERLEPSGHGAIDPVEGAVWRVQRQGEVAYLAKWLRQDKVAGCYLPQLTGNGEVWNWRPEKEEGVA